MSFVRLRCSTQLVTFSLIYITLSWFLQRGCQAFVIMQPLLPYSLARIRGPTSVRLAPCSSPVSMVLDKSLYIPTPTSSELLRLELKRVSIDATRKFLLDWGGKRVPDRPDVEALGVPRTSMATTTELKTLEERGKVSSSGVGLRGLLLRFDASPTDYLSFDAYPLKGGSSAIVVTRGEGGLAMNGGLGPQIASLIKDAEGRINKKLEWDIKTFATQQNMLLKSLGDAQRTDAYAEEQFILMEDDSEDITYSDDPRVVTVSKQDREPQLKRVPLPDTAFEGGTMYADPVDAFPGGREEFDRKAVEAFESYTREAETGEQGTEGTRKGFEGAIEDYYQSPDAHATLEAMFDAGVAAAKAKSGRDQLIIPLEQDLAQLGVLIGPSIGLQGGLDIFTGPPAPIGGEYDVIPESRKMNTEESRSSSTENDTGDYLEQLYTMCDENDVPLLQLTRAELEALDPDALELEMTRLDMLVSELKKTPSDLHFMIIKEYGDVLLDQYYILSMRARLPKMKSEIDRGVLQMINQRAVALVQQLVLTKQAQELQELEKIRTICEAAIENMETLPDKVRSMKALLNSDFVAYMGYAIEKEREVLRQRGMDPDKLPSRWLQVLGVIRKGVLAELEKDVYLDVQAVHYVLRMELPEERRTLLEKTVTSLPSMDVRNFKNVARNIVSGVVGMRGVDSVDAELSRKIQEFGTLLEEVLPDSRVQILSREADLWAQGRATDRANIMAEIRAGRPSVDGGWEGEGALPPVVDIEQFFVKQQEEEAKQAAMRDEWASVIDEDWELWGENELESQQNVDTHTTSTSTESNAYTSSGSKYDNVEDMQVPGVDFEVVQKKSTSRRLDARKYRPDTEDTSVFDTTGT